MTSLITFIQFTISNHQYLAFLHFSNGKYVHHLKLCLKYKGVLKKLKACLAKNIQESCNHSWLPTTKLRTSSRDCCQDPATRISNGNTSNILFSDKLKYFQEYFSNPYLAQQFFFTKIRLKGFSFSLKRTYKKRGISYIRDNVKNSKRQIYRWKRRIQKNDTC